MPLGTYCRGGPPWPPSVEQTDSNKHGLRIGEHDLNRGRPRRAAPTVRFMVLFIALAFAPVIRAHEGPPFPLFVDQKVDRYVVSVWTDPDVGTALFFVILNDKDLPADLHVRIGVQPVSGRLAEVFYPAELENIQGR